MSTDPKPADDFSKLTLAELSYRSLAAHHEESQQPSHSSSNLLAWRTISIIEEAIAEHPEVSATGRTAAQLAAITSSVKAGNFDRARQLALAYGFAHSPNAFKVAALVDYGIKHAIPGFPYDEGFPQATDEQYVIVRHDGRRLDATVDLSTQYRSEGKQWQTSEGIFAKHVVAAWFIKTLPL